MSGEAPLVAKFGGTSMARPELVVPQLELVENNAEVVVVSAPGKDEAHPVKTTDMLLAYAAGEVEADAIQQRFSDILVATSHENHAASRAIVDGIPKDLKEWADRDDPVDALGEYWSARLFAVQTGREFVDAREIIRFRRNGDFAGPETHMMINSSLYESKSGRQFVVPGYYGRRIDGKVQTFERGGSDITGAVIARALGARAYDNWSDVDGFMTADPRKVAGAQLLEDSTYRESRELGNGGSELLHREVIKQLGGTGIVTVMKNTFGAPGNAGTRIADERDWQHRPIVAVTGRDDLVALNLHEFGLNEGIGTTVDVYKTLQEARIPYEHTADGTDDVSIFVANKYQQEVEAVAQELRSHGRKVQTTPAGLLHVVGEGLAHSGTVRLRAMGAVASALAEAGIEGRGATDVGGSVTLTLFVEPTAVFNAVHIAHDALELAA